MHKPGQIVRLSVVGRCSRTYYHVQEILGSLVICMPALQVGCFRLRLTRNVVCVLNLSTCYFLMGLLQALLPGSSLIHRLAWACTAALPHQHMHQAPCSIHQRVDLTLLRHTCNAWMSSDATLCSCEVLRFFQIYRLFFFLPDQCWTSVNVIIPHLKADCTQQPSLHS
jgi:hypothetical protein